MSTSNKILTLAAAQAKVKQWQDADNEVVFTNGCFDIVHLGHIDYLEKAKTKGDKLVVAINSDASVQRLKGPKRPLVDETARARMMAAFEFVDMVLIFDEDTPLQTINALKPQILVKGNDYTIENIVGAKEVIASGGRVETIELVAGYSTSKIINKILNQK